MWAASLKKVVPPRGVPILRPTSHAVTVGMAQSSFMLLYSSHAAPVAVCAAAINLAFFFARWLSLGPDAAWADWSAALAGGRALRTGGVLSMTTTSLSSGRDCSCAAAAAAARAAAATMLAASTATWVARAITLSSSSLSDCNLLRGRALRRASLRHTRPAPSPALSRASRPWPGTTGAPRGTAAKKRKSAAASSWSPSPADAMSFGAAVSRCWSRYRCSSAAACFWKTRSSRVAASSCASPLLLCLCSSVRAAASRRVASAET